MLNLKYKRDRRWLTLWLLLIAAYMLGNVEGDLIDSTINNFFGTNIDIVSIFVDFVVTLYLPFFIIRTIYVRLRGKEYIKDGYSKDFDEKVRAKQILEDLETYKYFGRHFLWDERRTKKKRKKLKDELSFLKKKYKSKVTKITKKARKKQKKESIPLTKQELEEKKKREERDAERLNMRLQELERGKLAAKVICPHCHETGHVRRKVEKHTEKTSEDSIIGAVIGKKMVTDKGNITKFFCENCETPWTA